MSVLPYSGYSISNIIKEYQNVTPFNHYFHNLSSGVIYHC